MAKILIKNGRVFDGERFFYADVMTSKNKISDISEEINDGADFVLDAKGMTVCPGLVDSHVHFKGISSDTFGMSADMGTLPFGVTAAIDASGTQGDRARLDSFSVKNLVYLCGIIENNRLNTESAERFKDVYGDKAVGLKMYFDKLVSNTWDITPMKDAVEYAEKLGLKIMVHSSNPPVPMSELLSVLRPGDILTHAYHGGENNVSDDGYECVKAAKARGVIIDAGLAGNVHTDFAVFKGAIECGAIPDVISTDITKLSAYKRGGRYGLPMCMSIALTLGMNETDVFKAVTSNPARAYGMENKWGNLKEGRTADIAVLEYTDEGFELTDKAGNKLQSSKGYRNVMTVLDGEIVYKR